MSSAVNPFVVPGGPTAAVAAPMLGEGGLSSGAFATVVTYDADNTKEEEQAAQAKVDVVFDRLVEETGATHSSRGG